MSRHEWEEGVIQFGTKEWKPFREKVIAAFNDEQTRLYELNLKLYETLVSNLKGARGADRHKKAAFTLAKFYAQYGDNGRRAADNPSPVEPDQAMAEACTHILTGTGCDHERPLNWLRVTAEWPRDFVLHDMKKPLKKDYAHHPLSKSFVVEGVDWYLCLDNETRTLDWRVSENNHACRDAHQVPFVKRVFEALADTRFSRGNGGIIQGNDEYNRDCGSGANYPKFKYEAKPGQYQKPTHRGNSFSPGW